MLLDFNRKLFFINLIIIFKIEYLVKLHCVITIAKLFICFYKYMLYKLIFLIKHYYLNNNNYLPIQSNI